MKAKIATRIGVLMVVLLLASTAVGPTLVARAAEKKAPVVFASPINGGCYIAAPDQCRLHVDPFTINIGTGNQLEAFQLMANGMIIYDYRSDVSNPPAGPTYMPSTVALDFAAVCGQTYVLNIVGKNRQDPNFLNMGQTASFSCPATVP